MGWIKSDQNDNYTAYWTLKWCAYLGFLTSVLNLLFSIYVFRVAKFVRKEPEYFDHGIDTMGRGGRYEEEPLQYI